MVATTCTCGACIGGVLSPRMAQTLTDKAQELQDAVLETMPDFGGQPMHDPPVYLLEFLPPDLRLVVEPQVAAGWAAMFGVLAYLLRQRQLPKPRLVPMCAGAAPGVDGAAAKRLLAAGGLPEFSLDALLAAAEEEAAGAAALGGGGGGQPPAACANDSAFELLRQHLFCDSNVWPCGPYVMDGGEGGEYGEADDGWTYYDTSNWKPPGGSGSS